MRKIATNLLPIVFVLTLFPGLFSSADSSAIRSAPQFLKIKEVIAYYDSIKKNHDLNDDQANILSLITVAQDSLGVKDLQVLGYLPTKEEKIKSITLNAVATVIQDHLQSKKNWDETMPPSNLEKIMKNADLIKKALGDKSFAWAWITYKKGDKVESKRILDLGFETEYTNVMKMTNLGFRYTNPLQNAEAISRSLNVLSTEKENKTREDKLQKMRTHISSLPDLQMMT